MTGATAATASWVFNGAFGDTDSIPIAQKPSNVLSEASPRSAERWISSVCHLCSGGCGIRVRMIGDHLNGSSTTLRSTTRLVEVDRSVGSLRPVKIQGNPFHPINRGGLCPTGQSGLHILYSHDRIRTPLKRVGERGAHQWQSVTWDEAFELPYQKLLSLRKEGSTHKVVFMDGGARGIVRKLFERFMSSYGSPNYIDMSGHRNETVPYMLTQGVNETPVFDLANTNYILSFGYDLLEAEGAPVWQYRMYSKLREGKNGKRGKLVVIDPRFSITAAKADKWIPINPGTEAALALGIAHVLIQEELFNASFVEENTFGFHDWQDEDRILHKGFRTIALEKYYPETVSAITSVPIDEIFQLARGFAAHQPGVAVCGTGARMYSNGLFTQLAVHSLNALVGNLDKKGGILQRENPPLSPLPEISLDDTARAAIQNKRIDEADLRSRQRPETTRFPFAFDVPASLPNNILNGHPYDVECLILHNTNPLFELPESSVWRDAFNKVPLIVSIGSFMSESAEMADIILPEHTYLERWDDEWDTASINLPHLGIAQPVVQPLYDTKHAADIIITLGRKFGSEISQAFPFDDYLSTLKHAVKGIFNSHRGSMMTGTFEESMMEFMKERGWRYPVPDTFEEFWQSLVNSGGWFDIPNSPNPLSKTPYGSIDLDESSRRPKGRRRLVERKTFSTHTGKFEFFVEQLENSIRSRAATAAKEKGSSVPLEYEAQLNSLNIQAAGDEVFLPHFEEAQFSGNESLYPLHLKLLHLNTLMNASAVNTPAMMEMVGFRNNERWNSWMEINPITADALGISDSDLVWVESSKGKMKVKAKRFAGIMPNVVAIPYGMGHTIGQFSKQRGVNPMDLLAPTINALDGTATLSSTRVKVYRA